MNQVLEFIKTHTLALACGVVALVAIGVYFFVVPGSMEEAATAVRTETEEPYKKIETLRTQTRKWFNYKVDGTEADTLPDFPTRRLIDLGTAKLKELSDQAAAALTELRTANEMKPLVPNALPEASRLAVQQFYDAYKAVTVQTGRDAKNGIIATVLQGALPPDPTEVTTEATVRANQISKNQLQYDPTGKPVNQQAVDAAINAMKAGLETELRVQRARTSKIYVSPGAVQVHPFTAQPVTALDSNTIFNAQVSLWLQQIAMQALADCNANATNVLDAPVKHLVALSVPMEVAPVTARGQATGFGAPPAEGEVAAPATLTPDATAEIKPDYKVSPLGYGHNSLYDAVQIHMVIRLDVRQLPNVLSTLGRGRLLKVTNVAYVRTVDMGAALNEKYIYDKTGKTPMVEVQLDCDVLLLRSWLAPLMPQDVRTYFANLANPAPAP